MRSAGLWLAGALLLAGLPAVGAPARTADGYALDTTWAAIDGQKIVVSSPFSESPGSGTLPLRVRIDNGAARELSYRVRTESSSSRWSSQVREHVRLLRVPAHTARTFEVMAPLGVPAGGASWSSLEVEITGAGVGRLLAQRSGRVPGSGDAERATVGFGAELPDPATELAGAVKGELHVVSVEPGAMPSDWTGLLGLDGLWLSTQELEAVPSEARQAIVAWLAQGGQLVLLCTDDEAVPGALPFSAEQWADGRYGLGRLHRLSVQTSSPESLRAALSSLRARVIVSQHVVRSHRVSQVGALQQEPEPVVVERGRIMGLLAVLAILIGPFNLFLIAPRRRRMRLLWSTPLLSLGSSLALFTFILLQDGVGGQGQRLQLVLQVPSNNLEHRFQIQSSRTGLVPFGGFELPDALHLEPLPVNTSNPEEGRRLATGPERAEGDWFVTRATQAQLLQTLSPSRARLQLEPGPDGGLRLRSSSPDAVESLVLVAPDGSVWKGGRLEPGGVVELEPAPHDQAQSRIEALAASLPGHLAEALKRNFPQPGWMFATLAPGSGWPTHASIDWQDRQGVLLAEVRDGQ